jgi:hypothetical protein
MNINNGYKLGKEIVRTYGGIYSSQDVVDSIVDYCIDAQLDFSYDDLMEASFIVSQEEGVMRPTSEMIRLAMEVIKQNLRA